MNTSAATTLNDAGPVVMLRLPEVERRTGLKKSALYKRIRKGEFPRQTHVGNGTSGSRWIESEVEAWIAARVEARKQP